MKARRTIPEHEQKYSASMPQCLAPLHGLGGKVERAEHVLLFLDFDGTLAPIVDRPALAALTVPMRAVIDRLTRHADVTIAVLSGRSLADVRRRVNIDGLIYGGNHGLEIEGRGLSFQHPAALMFREPIARLAAQVARRSAILQGVEIESKGYTLAVHYRRASPGAERALYSLLRELVGTDDPRFDLRPAKKLWEIHPRIDWNKGRAICYMRDRLVHPQALSIAIGDDTTDEDMFESCRDGITIRIGTDKKSTAARYKLASPDHVQDLLAWIADLRAERDRRLGERIAPPAAGS
jgi:trehalose 6-phosphate phosphatase